MEQQEFVADGCAVITVSDTRTLQTDESGKLAIDRLDRMGHRLVARSIVPDDKRRIQALVASYVAHNEIDVVVLTGGSGITKRDVTPDAVAALGTKHIPGFGELFRYLSYHDIGTSAIQSRADAWLCESTLVFVLPGSRNAVELAMDKILSEQLDVRHKPCNFIQLMPRIK